MIWNISLPPAKISLIPSFSDMHSDERDHRTACAYGSDVLIAQPDLMNEVLSQVLTIILTAYTRPGWSEREHLEANIGEGLDRIIQSTVERFLIGSLSDRDLFCAMGSVGSDRSTLAQAIKQEEFLRSLRDQVGSQAVVILGRRKGIFKLHSRHVTSVD